MRVLARLPEPRGADLTVPKIGTRIQPSQLDAPTTCSDFTVADVLGHMTGAASAFAPMFRGAEPTGGDPEPDDTTDNARFDAAMSELLDSVQSPGALDRTIQTPDGEMPGAVFSRLVAFDGAVHGWDLAATNSSPNRGDLRRLEACLRLWR